MKDKVAEDLFDYLDEHTGKFDDEHQKIYDDAVKAEKKLINAENKAEEKE